MVYHHAENQVHEHAVAGKFHIPLVAYCLKNCYCENYFSAMVDYIVPVKFSVPISIFMIIKIIMIITEVISIFIIFGV